MIKRFYGLETPISRRIFPIRLRARGYIAPLLIFLRYVAEVDALGYS